MHLVTEGRRVHLYAVTDIEVIDRGEAEVPEEGTLAG